MYTIDTIQGFIRGAEVDARCACPGVRTEGTCNYAEMLSRVSAARAYTHYVRSLFQIVESYQMDHGSGHSPAPSRLSAMAELTMAIAP